MITRTQHAAYVHGLPGEKYEVRGRIVHETTNAILFRIDALEREEWFPLSQVDQIHREFPSTGYDRLVVGAWIAKKKGVID